MWWLFHILVILINTSRVYTFLIIFVLALEIFNVSVVMIPKKSIACSSLSLKFIVEVLLWVVSILAIVVSILADAT